jgi:hypothetical protein
MLLGLVDNDSPDLSGFATKQELQDAVTELQPVDEVTVGNMQSVTSNAVAEAIGTPQLVYTSSTLTMIGIKNKTGTYLNFHFNQYKNGITINYVTTSLFVVPEGWRPAETVRFHVHIDSASDRIALGVDIATNGNAICYPLSKGMLTGSVDSQGIYGDAFVKMR